MKTRTRIFKKVSISKCTEKLAILSESNKIRCPLGCHIMHTAPYPFREVASSDLQNESIWRVYEESRIYTWKL